jgi:hypothetical protein
MPFHLATSFRASSRSNNRAAKRTANPIYAVF